MNENVPEKANLPRSVELAQHIRTGKDFANTMGAIMADVLSGKVTPQVANAAVNAGGKLLKVVEMQIQYGTKQGSGQDKILELVDSTSLPAKGAE
jgi:hypothetical protein